MHRVRNLETKKKTNNLRGTFKVISALLLRLNIQGICTFFLYTHSATRAICLIGRVATVCLTVANLVSWNTHTVLAGKPTTFTHCKQREQNKYNINTTTPYIFFIAILKKVTYTVQPNFSHHTFRCVGVVRTWWVGLGMWEVHHWGQDTRGDHHTCPLPSHTHPSHTPYRCKRPAAQGCSSLVCVWVGRGKSSLEHTNI